MKEARIERVLALLEEVTGYKPRRSGGGYSGLCPAHPDRQPSLTVAEGDDQPVIVKCQAGCDTFDVLKALGLTWRDVCSERSGSTQHQSRSRRRPSRPPASPQDTRFAIVPACIVERADPVCIALYAHLALRCGGDNRHQYGWDRIASALGVNVKTLRKHAEHLAGTGWLNISATTTAAGAHKSSELWLAHCPRLGIIAKGTVLAPNRDHASSRRRTGVRESLPDAQVTGVRESLPDTPVTDGGNGYATVDAGCLVTADSRSRYVEVLDTRGRGKYVGDGGCDWLHSPSDEDVDRWAADEDGELLAPRRSLCACNGDATGVDGRCDECRGIDLVRRHFAGAELVAS